MSDLIGTIQRRFLFCNPDMGIALQPGRLEHQLSIIAEMAKLDRLRLIK